MIWFYIFWGVGALMLWAVLARVVYLEQRCVDTGMKYGHVILVALLGLVPIVNISTTFVIVLLFPGLVDTSDWWINRSVHKGENQ